MQRLDLAELLTIAILALIIFGARLPKIKPPRFPRHPVPAFEPLFLIAQSIRRKVDSWHS